MILGMAIVLVLVTCIAKGGLLQQYTACDFHFSVLAGNDLVVTNPEWPSSYKRDEMCRWVLTCPEGYNCHLVCNFVEMPMTEDCSHPGKEKCDIDKLLVSLTGDMVLYGANVYCGRSVIDTHSFGQKITIGLITSPSSPGGKFRCTVTPKLDYQDT